MTSHAEGPPKLGHLDYQTHEQEHMEEADDSDTYLVG
jgi:hypothetical protein